MSPLTSFKLSELANILEAELDGNPDIEIFGLSSLDLASEKDISFISRESFIPQLQSTSAAAIICSKALSDHYKGSKLISDDPYLLYAKCSSLFKSKPLQNPGISKLASVDSSASVADSAVISSFVSVSKNSIIEDDVILMPGVFIGNDTVVKKGTIIHSNASIYESIEIGEGCIIHSGVVIGSDGLGFAKESNQWVKIEHLGKVLIGNNVELGSNTTIDRGSVGDTVLGDNIKIQDIMDEVAGVYPKIMQEGTMDSGAWSCGMVAGLINDIPTCEELINQIMNDAMEIINDRFKALSA